MDLILMEIWAIVYIDPGIDDLSINKGINDLITTMALIAYIKDGS